MPMILKHLLLPSLAPQTIHLSPAADILSVGAQNGELFIWALHHTDKLIESRQFIVVPTGVKVSGITRRSHIGTIHAPPFVWHVFEVMS